MYVIFNFYDLEISITLTKYDGPFYEFFDDFGELPIYIGPVLFGAIYFSIVLEWSIPYKILFLLICIFFIVELYLRFCLLLVVKCYQNLAKTKTRRRCKCIPSCSEYAVICIKRVFPLLLALLKIRKRLYHTCNGEEYKIDFPFRKMGEEFESRL